MVYRGTVKGNVVVLDPGAELPDGTPVHVEPDALGGNGPLAGGNVIVKPSPSRGELARQLMGAGRRWLKPGVDPIADLIRDREQDDGLDQVDQRR